MRSPQTAPVRSPDLPLAGMRLAIAYDCLFPWTVGGAERWYRALAEAAVSAGATVTYLTRRQWDDPPEIPGVEVVAVSAGGDLYDADGRRLLGPTLRFGLGCARHLVRHRRRYDVVQTANFPFWSLIGARAALVGTGRTVVVDWHEVWSPAFWRSYAGRVMGSVGWLVQRLCIALSAHPVTTSARNAQRLKEAGCRNEPVVLPGYFPSGTVGTGFTAAAPATDRPYVLFAGRHIRDKGVDLLPDLAGELAKLETPIDLVIAGDGPGRTALEATIAEQGLVSRVRCVGFVEDGELQGLLGGARVVIVPSRREGYGIVVVEATSHGTPVVVADFPENLAVDHVVQGVNGYVTDSTVAAMVSGVAHVLARGEDLRASTRAWFDSAASAQTIAHSTVTALAQYEDVVPR